MRRSLAGAVLILALASCGRAAGRVATPPPEDPFRANLDTTVAPGVDFFTYANGGWIKRHPIPASEASWGIAKEVYEALYTTLRGINERAAAAQAPAGSDEQKIGDYWRTAMDSSLADRLGASPLAAQLARIDSIRSPAEAIDAAFALRALEVGAFFDVSVAQDEKHSDAMAIHLSQGGLGLPDRDFYFNSEAGVAHIRTEYVAHIARTLALLGPDSASAARAATQVLAFETALAKASRKLEELRDPERNYHKRTPDAVTARETPSIRWSARFAAWGQHPDSVIVGQPEFFAAVDRLVARTPVPVLRDYLRYHLVSAYSPFLGRAFDEERFRFVGRVLNGQREERARWKRVLDYQDRAMGMVVGKVFVAEYFPERAKERYVALVAAIRAAYAERIVRLEWMSEGTKGKALDKLRAITAKVGYPDRWKDYSKLVVGRASFAENEMHAARWRFDDQLAKLGKPVDRSEWEMTPQTYNAYYNPSNNEIVLPAAVFTVPGMADSTLDDALVYGYAAAATIGHEITHGFDDEGRQFDAAGNLKDWWTKEDGGRFRRRSEVMVRQFDAYEPIAGIHINGKASLGENLADYGGVLLGLDAFKRTEQYRRGERIAGFTPVQRYFLGYALGWQETVREEQLREGLLSDVHAPAKWRVLGPLSNVPEFYEAFGVTRGQPMWRADSTRVRVW